MLFIVMNEKSFKQKKDKTGCRKVHIDPKNETNTITTSDGQEFRVVATQVFDPVTDLMDWQLHLL